MLFPSLDACLMLPPPADASPATGDPGSPASRDPFPQIPAFEGRCIPAGFVARPHRTAAGTPRPGASPDGAHRPSRCTASSGTDLWMPGGSVIKRSRPCARLLPVPLAGQDASLHRPLRGTPRSASGPRTPSEQAMRRLPGAYPTPGRHRRSSRRTGGRPPGLHSRRIPAFEDRCIPAGFVARPHRTAVGTPRSCASPFGAHRPSRCTASSGTEPETPDGAFREEDQAQTCGFIASRATSSSDPPPRMRKPIMTPRRNDVLSRPPRG
ncbi:MAG: hypothetical protein XU12_C0017G0009 [Deltaproteobacteria bacterium CSP1-8]|nr:MAG: hypothetical protein XU12_C0017G0009 [Deltaproteobacteria bacterium CSP1-8]